ncbi:uncharacterized protein [Argopecten irradians]
MPVDVRCQNDVNYLIYRTLSSLGIEEVSYPLPKDGSLNELRTIPLHHFWSEDNAYDLYRENTTFDERAAPKSVDRQPPVTKQRGQTRVESVDVGCRQHKKDVGAGKRSAPRRKHGVTLQKDKECVTVAKEWNDLCVLPGNSLRPNPKLELQEYCKEPEDPNGGILKTVSIADNYSAAEISSLDSCLAPPSEVDRKVEAFLSKQELCLPILILPEASRSNMPTSNPKYTRHDRESYYVVGTKEPVTPQDMKSNTEKRQDQSRIESDENKPLRTRKVSRGKADNEFYNNFISKLKAEEAKLRPAQTDPRKGQSADQTDDERVARKARLSEKVLDIGHLQDGLSDDDNKIKPEKASTEVDENLSKQQKMHEGTSDNHHNEITDRREPDVVASPATENLQDASYHDHDILLEDRYSACSSRSAEDFCEASSGRRVSWASDMERDMRSSHSRNSCSRSSRDKSKVKRSHRRQTPVIMYSESECSLLCQKYNN